MFNGEIYFSADDGTAGRELWKSDGTDSGTVMVKDINTTAAGSASLPRWFTIFPDGLMYFRATDGTNGNELWRTDGTDAGTTMVKDIHPTGDGFTGL